VDREEIKLYFDYKSPFAFLAAEPAFALEERYAVRLRWIPYQLRIKGKGERSVYSEWKVLYSYLDARRAANRRGGIVLRGPRKVYDTTPALIGGLFAMQAGLFRPYTLQAFARFFRHELELDVPEAIEALLGELGAAPGAFRAYLQGEGPAALDAALAEGERDHIFGVPIFVHRGEPFWGHDRIPLLEERLAEHGLVQRT
jgi:2-hydroxychromene-2-carboxylate isomerase